MLFLKNIKKLYFVNYFFNKIKSYNVHIYFIILNLARQLTLEIKIILILFFNIINLK